MVIDEEFKKRRDYLLSQIGHSGIAILAAAKECYRARDWVYPYRQNSDFYYLTGFTEPNAIAVFIPFRKEGEYILFSKEPDPELEIWFGKRAGLDEICKSYGVDQVFSMDRIDEIIPNLLVDRERLYLDIGRDNDFDVKVNNWVNHLKTKIRAGVRAPKEYIHIDKILHEMRMQKSPKEISLIRRAVQVTKAAQLRAMKFCKPQIMEYELEAEVMHEFIKHGCCFQSFVPIIAGGANSCVLHYIKNNSKLNDGDLVLVDIGAEYEYYAGDITRTFPANGKFSQEQKAIYQAVLDAQLAVIDQIRPGVTWDKLQKISELVITEKLLELGILHGDLENLVKNKTFKAFYMHHIGHWLGLDCHDVGEYKPTDEWRVLESGMVFTVEPGIYIRANTQNVDKKWWNIGVRIEDDILVTENGCELLSAGLPKTVEEIENYMGR